MRRIQDKVKDIVEVRPFRSIRDFTSDPAETVGNYRFTDATADLMAKWLDAISNVRPGAGCAHALAGYRGVGKSHFLATLGALASSPDLRGRISESHVEFSAQRLQRRHFPVSYLKRGTHTTLIEEFRAAVAGTFQIDSLAGLTTFDEILNAAAEQAGELPWVLLIDTALERGSRVTRDDGEQLSQIAEAARSRNVFVGVALDDDIAGADGSNAAIVRSYSIDYLDQAHLYRVVNGHVFPKDSTKLPVLHEIYGYFREVLPSFRWSEQKFSSLYPLHPAILEVAPYVRLYVHEFALLGFASEAGEKILGRPANSLIALDEVFDSAEAGLRKIDDLHEAFAAYDSINANVVSTIPVMQRLQAKLILKALFLLSLDGQGGTASDICASELIFDEMEPNRAIETVDHLLRTFAEALPDGIRVTTDDVGEARYGFRVSSKENLNNALAEASAKVPPGALRAMLFRLFQERFPEAASAVQFAEAPFEGAVIDTEIVWRGARRPGAVVWATGGETSGHVKVQPWADWEVLVDLDDTSPDPRTAAGDGVAHVVWKPDPLRPDETERLRSFFLLTSDSGLQEKFSEQIRAAVHAHSVAAEKIVSRCFLEDGKLVIDGFDYNFTDEARGAQSLSELFSTMLEPLLETRYPMHPYYTRVLDTGDVASIVTDLYNGTRRDLAEVQSRAQTFAFPLGLVRLEGTSFVPETRERLAALPVAKALLQLVNEAGGEAVGLPTVHAELRKPPSGLGRESQEMLLTALVAERFVEFVTLSGNRINHRSLDLKIIWDDVVGIARPAENLASSENLKSWAKLFVGDRPFNSLAAGADRATLTAALAEWSSAWDNTRVLERFGELPDDTLNVWLWQLASKVAKTFGTIAADIRSAATGKVSLEECLEKIADAFSGSQTEFVERNSDLQTLTSFIRGTVLREEAKSYLLACEAIEDSDLESLRGRLLALVDLSCTQPDEKINRELGYTWEKFRKEYAEHFNAAHRSLMSSPERRRIYDDTIRGEAWAEFEILSVLPGFDQRFAAAAVKYRRQMNELTCTADTKRLLEKQPYCHCGFSFSRREELAALPVALKDTVHEGLASFRRTIAKNSDDLAGMISKLAEKTDDPSVQSAARELVSALRSGKEITRFGDIQLKMLAAVLGKPYGELTSPPRRSSAEAPTRNDQSFSDLESEPIDENVLLSI